MMQLEFQSLEPKAHLSDAQWDRIVSSLSGNTGTRARHDGLHHYRSFVEAVLWVACNRAFWSELPAEYGTWRSVYVRFSRWFENGIWSQVESALGSDDYGASLSLLLAHHRQEQSRRQRWQMRRSSKDVDDPK